MSHTFRGNKWVLRDGYAIRSMTYFILLRKASRSMTCCVAQTQFGVTKIM